MARRRGSTFTKKLIEAILYTPFIVLGKTKRTRKSAAKKWLRAIDQATRK